LSIKAGRCNGHYALKEALTMFTRGEIHGNDLPDKTLCLTFDDGPGETKQPGAPGPRTLELAQFLASRGITATFFVIGEQVAGHREIVQAVAQVDQLIGNHTYDHPHLEDKSGDFAAGQIIRTEHVLSGIPNVVKLFRPPYGSWSSTVAGQLNSTAAQTYTGPIMWDIDACDWGFWLHGRNAQECAEAYIRKIQEVGRGIVLMHDSSFEDDIRSQSYTFEAVKLLVDWLQHNGYSFIALNSIPQVRNALAPGEDPLQGNQS
jgi:peptidoglycan/xylan/chitin deacetylase (PgdA/CDA1 family)